MIKDYFNKIVKYSKLKNILKRCKIIFVEMKN